PTSPRWPSTRSTARPTAGTTARTSRANRVCTCPTSAAWGSTAGSATAWPPAATRASRSSRRATQCRRSREQARRPGRGACFSAHQLIRIEFRSDDRQEETMTDVATTHPLSTATARALERELFGHVIDGATVPSLDGGTMPVIDPATGEQIATAASGSAEDVARAVRSARAAYDDGRWRHLPPHEKERRLRRLADLLGERAVLDAGLLRWYTTFVVEAAVASIEYYAGWPTKLEGTIPATPPEFAVS